MSDPEETTTTPPEPVTYADPGEEFLATIPTTGHIFGVFPPTVVSEAAVKAFDDSSRHPSDWYGLPIKIRRQWLVESEQGRKAPSLALRVKVHALIEADYAIQGPVVYHPPEGAGPFNMPPPPPAQSQTRYGGPRAKPVPTE